MNIDPSSAIFSNWQIHDAKEGGGKKELTANVKIGNNTYCITVNYNKAMADALSKQGPNAHKTLQKIIESSSPQIKELIAAFEKNNKDRTTFMTLKAKPFTGQSEMVYHSLPNKSQQGKVEDPKTEEDAKEIGLTENSEEGKAIRIFECAY